MPPEWTQTGPGYCSIPGLDPYVTWALGEGRGYFFRAGQEQWMPVLLQLKTISAADFAAGRPFIDDEDERLLWRQSVRVPAIYLAHETHPERGTYLTALVTVEFFNFLERNKRLRTCVPRVTLGLPLDRVSLADAGTVHAPWRSRP